MCYLAWFLAMVSLSSFAQSPDEAFRALEKKTGVRIGIAAIDTGSGKRIEFRGNEKFLMCSTFKLLLAAHVLKRVDEGKENMDREVAYGAADLLEYAPIARKHVGEKKMKVGELCAASVQYSDNTAANLLLRTQGGPQGLTAFLRSIGDETTRSDRIEPALNVAEPEKDLDTTTPHAMAEAIRKLVLEKALSEKSRKQLETWLLGNTTGKTRLAAGLPKGWRIGDKTGTGDDATNDVGVLYPPKGAPIVVSAFVAGAKAPRAELEKVLAAIASYVSESRRP